jgi:epoxyqueuosine reductase QueG
LNWTEESRREAFKTSAMKRATLENMRRNALIASGNALAAAPHDELLNRIRSLAVDTSESEVIRETAQAVLERLSKPE